MADRPILMSGPMVRAVLDGRKTQTRRAVNPQPPVGWDRNCWYSAPDWGWTATPEPSQAWHVVRCPYGQPGDRLWVREAWWQGLYRFAPDAIDPPELPEPAFFYRADKERNVSWKPSIHMPRWASRLTLTLTDVRVERVQDISEEDAKTEGAAKLVMDDDSRFYEDDGGTYRTGFAGLWEHINAKRGYGWDTNPWAWALSFTVTKANIDQ
ncbi:MAG: hypothetical protein AAF354_07385, partial [Pseudomonadota bacterium]